MEQAPDRLRYILDRPITLEPGQSWVYNGGTSALLGALIEQGTGQPLDAFARDALFAPLGIERFDWTKGADGVASAASGLRLTARDLAQIGQLILSGGTHAGREIVPKRWLEQSTTAKIAT